MSSVVRSVNVSDFFFLILLCVGFCSYTSITRVPQIQRSDSIQSQPSSASVLNV